MATDMRRVRKMLEQVRMFDVRLRDVLDGRGESTAAGLSNFAVQCMDRVESDAAKQVCAFLWAAARYCHRLGGSRELMHEIIDKAWAYSVEDDKRCGRVPS